MAKYIDAEQLLRELREAKRNNLECPLTPEDFEDPDINNYDCGLAESFDVIIKLVERKLADKKVGCFNNRRRYFNEDSRDSICSRNR